MSRDVKEQCPYCQKKKKNLKSHIRLAHPDKVLPPIFTTAPTSTPIPAAIPTVSQQADIKIQRLSPIKWWRFILGAVCAGIGIIGIVMYGTSLNVAMGIVAIAGLVPGAFLIYYSFNRKESGYVFQDKAKQYNGRENSIKISATYNPETKRAVPDRIEFAYIEIPLPGARLHLLRNNGRHYYEYMNIVGEGKIGDELMPVILPDKKLCTPEAFCIPSNMPRTKEYMDFNPPTNFQKIASGVLILVMVIIGILMVMTGNPTENKTVSRENQNVSQIMR
jgi:hypothetical protein